MILRPFPACVKSAGHALASLSLWCVLLTVLQTAPAWAATAVPIVPCEIVATFPHDPTAFTQGLLFHNGALYESTGLYGDSRLRKVDLESGRVLAETRLEDTYFAEGLTLVQGKLAQLTWQEGRGLLWDLETLAPAGSFAVEGEGWGLAMGPEHLYLTQGKAEVLLLDPQTFRVTGRLPVTAAGRPLHRLNELEWVEGKLYANIWHAPYIAVINPESGVVEQLIDLTPCQRALPGGKMDPDNVANGIAWDAEGRRLFVTGKRWPRLFQIALPPQ